MMPNVIATETIAEPSSRALITASPGRDFLPRLTGTCRPVRADGPAGLRASLMVRSSTSGSEVRVDDDGEGVGGDLELDVLDPLVGTGRDFLLVDRTGGVRDVGLALAEHLEATAR